MKDLKQMKKHIWLEAEWWVPESWTPEDVNLDAIVTFTDRSRWMASFFTYKNIESLRKKNMNTGECMSGAYFWASDMVLIDYATRERIEEVIEYMLEHEEFDSKFTRIPDAEAEDDHLYPEGFFQ